MTFLLERVSQPAIEPVTLAEMKTHLKEFSDLSDNDDRISEVIAAAREWCEDFTGLALIDQTWRLSVGAYSPSFRHVDSDTVTGYYRGVEYVRGDGSILLRRSPILAITSFVTVDAAGDETAIDAGTYEVREADSKAPVVYPLTGANWTAGPLRITYRAGYADLTASPAEDGSAVPALLRQAIKLYGQALYDTDRDTMDKLMDAAKRLARRERADLSLA